MSKTLIIDVGNNNARLVDDPLKIVQAKQVKAQARLAAQIEAYKKIYRKKRYNGGFTWNNVFVESDEQTRESIHAIWTKAVNGYDKNIAYKNPDGTWTDLTPTMQIALGDAAFEHGQKCFLAERAITDQTFDSIAAVEAAFDAAYEAS